MITGVALSDTTDKDIHALEIGDFSVSCILKGSCEAAHFDIGVQSPRGAVAIRDWHSGGFTTYEYKPQLLAQGCSSSAGQPHLAVPWGAKLFTTSNECLSQCFVMLDSFQAFDLHTRVWSD